MKENLTEIVFIIDKSGSMFDIAKDTIGGFNSFIESQKKEPGEATLTTVLFDTECETIHDGVNIKDARLLTREDYRPIGMTALYDAVGGAIDEVGRRLYETPEDQRPSKVIFVITTDGLDNASHEYTRSQVKDMITHQTEKYNWEFMFLGANINAEEAATEIGISASMTSAYNATSVGTTALYSTISNAVSGYRSCGSVDANWSEGLANVGKSNINNYISVL